MKRAVQTSSNQFVKRLKPNLPKFSSYSSPEFLELYQDLSTDSQQNAINLAIHDHKDTVRELQSRPNNRNLRLYFIRHGESQANLVPGEIGGRQSESPLSSLGEDQARDLGKRLKQVDVQFDVILSSSAVRAYHTACLACNEMGIPYQRIIQCDDLVELCQGEWERQKRTHCYTEEAMELINANNWEFRPPGVNNVNERGESQRDCEERVKQFIESHLLPLSPTPIPLSRNHCAAPESLTQSVDNKNEAKEENSSSTTSRSNSTTDNHDNQLERFASLTSPVALPNSPVQEGFGVSLPDDFQNVAIFAHGMVIKFFLRSILKSSPTVSHKLHLSNTSVSEFVYSNNLQPGRGGWFLRRFNDAKDVVLKKSNIDSLTTILV